MELSPDGLERFGDWEIKINLDLVHLTENYLIPPDRLAETDWLSFLRCQPINWNEFFPAYLRACELNNIKQITLKIE